MHLQSGKPCDSLGTVVHGNCRTETIEICSGLSFRISMNYKNFCGRWCSQISENLSTVGKANIEKTCTGDIKVTQIKSVACAFGFQLLGSLSRPGSLVFSCMKMGLSNTLSLLLSFVLIFHFWFRLIAGMSFACILKIVFSGKIYHQRQVVCKSGRVSWR